jgi:peroxin-3
VKCVRAERADVDSQLAKCSLRRRFLQNQEDCNFTVVALLPTLGTQLLEAMDVERVTQQLQEMSGNVKKGTIVDAPVSETVPAQVATVNTEDVSASGAPPASSDAAPTEALPNGDSTHVSGGADTAQVDSAEPSSLTSSVADTAAIPNAGDATASPSHSRFCTDS